MAALLSALIMVPLVGVFEWFFAPGMFVRNGRITLASALVFLVVVSPLSSALGAILYPVKVTQFGIQGAPLVGVVEWTQMKSVRILWLGYLWARIARQNRFAPLWVPLALTDLKGFARTVEEWAPEDNPLRAWAQKRAS